MIFMKTTIMILSLVMASTAFADGNCTKTRDPASAHASTEMRTPAAQPDDTDENVQSGVDRGSAEYHFKFETPGGMRK